MQILYGETTDQRINFKYATAQYTITQDAAIDIQSAVVTLLFINLTLQAENRMSEVNPITSTKEELSKSSGMSFGRPQDDTLLVKFEGEWKLGRPSPSVEEVQWQQVDVFSP